MSDVKMEAQVIFDSYLPNALFRALEFASTDGFVASMPQLLHARSNAPFDNDVWNLPAFTTYSEESVATTAQGNQVVVAVHGGGLFASPERFRKLYHHSVDRDSEFGFTGLFAAKISQIEAVGVTEGKLPDGTRMPTFSYSEFSRGIVNLPRQYAVVMDFDTAKNSISANAEFDALKDDPMMIVRAGGAEAAAAYLDKAKSRATTDVMGSWHSLRDIRPDQAQTRVLFMGGVEGGAKTQVLRDQGAKEQGYVGIWGTHYRNPNETEFGIRSDTAMINPATYVAVAPRIKVNGVRDLDFTM